MFGLVAIGSMGLLQFKRKR
ncbi:hypothetical protein [Nodularia spumigena]